MHGQLSKIQGVYLLTKIKELSISINISLDNSELDGYLAESKMITEEELIEGCKKGKRWAQAELYNRYSASMLAVSMRYCRNVSEAEDALQEAFIRIFKYVKNFKGRHEGSLSAWIKTIVVNTTLSHNRNNKKHHYTEDVDDLHVSADPVPLFDDEVDVSRRKQEAIMKSMQKLPVGYRTVFNLYVVEGYTHKEIAEILGISENTSKSQLSKARKYLKKLLGVEDNL
ncbi:RNA polymerase sigma factor [Flavobacteriales bacterium]|nr:RNA polymerase sigma factor [Flavobacteriales bacterium]